MKGQLDEVDAVGASTVKKSEKSPSGVKLAIQIVPPGRQTRHLVGDRLVVRREDRAERGGDDVELPVCERERLGICLDPLELDSPVTRLAAPGLEVLGRQIRCDDVRPGLGGPNRVLHVPAATSRTRWPARTTQAPTSSVPTSQTVAFANAW